MPEIMLIVEEDVFHNDFDVSCFADEVVRQQAGTEVLRSLWQLGKPYKEIDDLTFLLLWFAWLHSSF